MSCEIIGLLRSRSWSQWRLKIRVNVCPDEIFLNHRLCYQIWYGDAASLAKKYLLSSRSRSQWGLIWSKYASFYYIFWTADSLATALGTMIHHHKPECLAREKKGGLLNSRSRSQRRIKMLMFIQMISSKVLNILSPDLALWYALSWVECHANRLVCFFKVKVTARAYMIKIWQFLLYLLNCWSFFYHTCFGRTLP